MATDPDFHIKPRRAALNHARRVDPVHRLRRRRAGATGCRAEERAFGPSPIPAPLLRVEVVFQVVMCRHLLALGLYRRACGCSRSDPVRPFAALMPCIAPTASFVARQQQFKRLNHVSNGIPGTQVASRHYSDAQRTTAREVDSSASLAI